MKILSLVNEKGGVGKTTLAKHIAAMFALMGQHVLIVDADPQANTTQQMRIAREGGLFNLLVRRAAWDLVWKAAPRAAWAGHIPTTGSLTVVPGNEETRAIPGLVEDVGLMRKRLEELTGQIDLVVIDTSPTPSLLQAMIYIATNAIVYPTQAQGLSLDGLNNSVGRVQTLNRTRKEFGLPSADMIGVVPTMLRRTSAHQTGIDMLIDHFGSGMVMGGLDMSTVYQDAEFMMETLFTYDPDHAATAQMRDVVLAINDRL